MYLMERKPTLTAPLYYLVTHVAVKQGLQESRFRNRSDVLERGTVADLQENVRAVWSSANLKSYSDRM